MASTYYQQNKERIIKYNKERYWRKKLEDKDVTIQKENQYLRKRIDALQQKVTYYQQRARAYRMERMEANSKVKELEEKLKNSVPKQTGAQYQKTLESINKLEELLKDTKQPRMLFKARKEHLLKLKESIGMPIYSSCAFGIN